MSPKRPINADVPAPDDKEGKAPAGGEADSPRPSEPVAGAPAEKPAEAKAPESAAPGGAKSPESAAPGGAKPPEQPQPEPQAKDEKPAKKGKKTKKDKPAKEPKPKRQKAPKPKRQKAPKPKRQKEPKPAAPKLLAALVLLALAFIAAAIVGGSGGEGEGDTTSAAPAPAPTPSRDPAEPPASPAEDLGFPSFATNNTVRIGGPDPIANAAAAALAVFPSVTAEQRPAAVTLVGEEDWAGAIAAAVLMAPPVRAPILFSNPEEMPEVTEEALAALDPQGSPDTGQASLFAVGSLAYPGEAVPIDSGDPAATAAQIATLRDRLMDGPPRHIVVASSSRPDFAMPAAAWAARSGDPVLYAGAKKLPQATAAYLEDHPKAPVYLLGPSSAISKQAVAEIEEISKQVERVAGEDPVATALAFAKFRDGDFGWNVNDPGHGFVLARSDSPADAAAAAPLSASGTWGPLLLTDDAAALPPAVRSYFLDVKPGYTTDPTRAFYNHVWVIGDQEAIDVGQQAEVDELAELVKIDGG